MNRAELLRRRSGLIAAQRAALDSHEHDPSWNPDRDQQYKARRAEIESLTLELQLTEFDTQRRAVPGGTQDHGDPGSAFRSSRHHEGGLTAGQEAELRSLASYIRNGNLPADMQQRTLSGAGSAAALLPLWISEQVIQDVTPLVTVLAGTRDAPGCQVKPISGNENVPIIADAVAVYYSESATDSGLSATDPVFTTCELRPNLLACRTQIKWSTLNRSAPDLGAELRGSFTRGIAATRALKFLRGSGVNEPEGLVVGGTSAVTTASANSFTAPELFKLYDDMPVPFRNQSVWLISAGAEAIIRGLEDTSGRPLIAADRQDGLNRILGRPVLVDGYLQSPASATKPVVLANLAAGYVCGVERNIQILSDPYSRSAYAESCLSLFLYDDGKVKNAAAIQYMTMKT